jgi:MerR family mercuric resistance operon transcriptional regulator/MerR family gold-responsive transcriptional activator of gol and ges genes
MAPGLTIGQLAKSVGVNVQTVRYYERRRLLTPNDRKPSGYRLYGDDAVRRLRFIRNAQALGFALREIAELLNLRVTSTARCGDVRRKAQAKLQQVEAKMRDLRALVRALRGLIKDCRAGQPTDRCPILQTLEKKEGKQSNGKRTTTR